MMTVGEIAAYLKLDDSEFNRKTDAAGKHFQSLGNRVEGIGKKLGHLALRGAAMGLVGLGAGLVAAAYAGIKYNSSIEQTTIAMGTMLGSTKKATVLIGEVTKLAAATPFEFPELADATKRLVAYGVSAGEAVPLLTRLGDISSALQVPIGELSDIYGKMKVSGRIMMEDINQLAGRGIPIYAALAKVMGKGKDEIRGLVEQGKVNFPDIERAFVEMTKKGSMFGGMMDKQSRSFAGLLSTAKDNATQLFGMVMMPAFTWLTKVGLPKAIKLVGEFGEGFKKGGLEGGLATIMDPKTAQQIVATLGTIKSVVFGVFGAIGKVAGVFVRLPGSIQKVIIAVGLLALAMKGLNVPIRLPSVGGAGAAGGAALAGGGVITAIASAASLAAGILVAGAALGVVIYAAKKWMDSQYEVPYNRQGQRVSGGASYGMPGLDVDTSGAGKSIAELEDKLAKLQTKFAKRTALGLNTDNVIDAIAHTQDLIGLFRDEALKPMWTGHLNTSTWVGSIAKAKTAFLAWKSGVQKNMWVGHLLPDNWTGPISKAKTAFLAWKFGVQADMWSGHLNTSGWTDPISKAMKAYNAWKSTVGQNIGTGRLNNLPSGDYSGPGGGAANVGGAGYGWASALAGNFGLSVSSTYRPGAITASGNISDHGTFGRAADIAGPDSAMNRLWAYVKSTAGSWKQAIHEHQMLNYGSLGSYGPSDHFDHVHLARMALGGGLSGPESGYLAMMHGRESVVAHNNPTRGLTDLAKSGLLGGNMTFGNVSIVLPPGDYGDSEDAGSAAADAFMQRTRELSRGY